VAIRIEKQCDDVTRMIISHIAGDAIRIDVLRDGATVTVEPTLATRSDILQHRVGRRMESTDLRDVDGVRHYDLGEHRSRALVVGAFSPSCTSCSNLVDRIAGRIGHRSPTASVLAVTESANFDVDLAQLRTRRGAVPLAIASRRPTRTSRWATTIGSTSS